MLDLIELEHILIKTQSFFEQVWFTYWLAQNSDVVSKSNPILHCTKQISSNFVKDISWYKSHKNEYCIPLY